MSLLRRILFILSALSGALPAYAQNGKEKDIRLNEEAVRMIQFDFSGTEEAPREEMKAVTLDKPWMDFKKDLRLPRSLTDTAKVKKPTGYVRMLPYTIWTRFGEDPVYDVLVLGRPDSPAYAGLELLRAWAMGYFSRLDAFLLLVWLAAALWRLCLLAFVLRRLAWLNGWKTALAGHQTKGAQT